MSSFPNLMNLKFHVNNSGNPEEVQAAQLKTRSTRRKAPSREVVMENDPLLRARQAAQCVDPTLIPSALITRSETIKCSYQPVQRQNNSTSD